MVNQATILGRVGKIDTKTSASGVKVCNISMVTSKKFMKNGEKVEKVTWHNVTMFSKLAEITETYVAVGDMLYIQGEMDNSKYVDANGQQHLRFNILASNVEFLPKSREQKAAPPPEKTHGNVLEDSDVPW